MILLDTNVVSEAMKPEGHSGVREWLDRRPRDELFLSAITLAELRSGVLALPDGRRRDGLERALAVVMEGFRNRVLPFDQAAALCYAELAARARIAGRGFPLPDAYIAAIAVDRRLSVATRDASAFLAAGLEVIDPWNPAP